MQVFRKFDYFRKSTSPEAIKSTFMGGIISIMCVVVSFFPDFVNIFAIDPLNFDLQRAVNFVRTRNQEKYYGLNRSKQTPPHYFKFGHCFSERTMLSTHNGYENKR